MAFDKLCETENGARGPYFGKSEEEAAMLVMIKLGKAVKSGGDHIDDYGRPIFDIGFWDVHTIIHLLAKAYANSPPPAKTYYANGPLPYPRGAP